MPYYRNKLNRKVTVFIKNSIAVKFYPNESKLLKENDLDKVYPKYIEKIADKDVKFGPTVTETVTKTPKVEEKEVISEVKQPTPDKELVTEPIEEEVKVKIEEPEVVEEKPKKKKKTPPKRKKKQKINEGYKRTIGETVVAGASKQG